MASRVSAWIARPRSASGAAPTSRASSTSRDSASRVLPQVSAQLEPAGARIVGPDKLAAVMAESGRVTINVHVPYEGDIAGTDLSIPFDQITELGDLLPQQRSTPLAIYCHTGP